MKRTLLLSAFITALAASAGATTITILSATGIAGANADKNAWVAANFASGSTTQNLENFEGFKYGPYATLTTGAGIFSIEAGGLPSESNGTRENEFTILNSSDTPFSGRYNTTPSGKNWLDSNDITKLKLTTTQSSLYFFITDVNDIDGLLRLKTAYGTTSSGFAPGGVDGNIYFVGIKSAGPIGSVQWLNNSQNDGFGLDDFGTVSQIHSTAAPEPSTWLGAITGLLLVIVSRATMQRKGDR